MPKRLSENEVLSKKLQCERRLCLGFIRRVLGGFLEGSRHVLGRISARSRRNSATASNEVLRGAKDSPKGAQRKPKGAKRRQKGAQRQPKEAKRKAKGSPGGGKTAPKTIKNRSFFWKAFLTRKWCHRNSDSHAFGSILAPFWEPNSKIFRVIFWLRFLIDF